MSSHVFIDKALIDVRSGKGGDGMVHFRREKYVPRGGPDGGDGGRGGDVILEVDPALNSLSTFQRKRRYSAENGAPGGPSKRSGRSGEDLVLLVPPGTLVYRESDGDLLGDLIEPGQRLVVAKGGRGGRGNVHFATARKRTPRLAERGEPEQELQLRLELKLIADIGIIGVPNAGKSTLLAALTRAKPKIADYPFTTLQPNLGVVALDDDTTLVLADIPGLIEGAHEGVGLGHDFLRHLQRTRVLIHLLDGAAEDPLADFAQINSELALFDPELGRKPQVLAINKMDLPDVQARWPELEKTLSKQGNNALSISALARDNLQPLLARAAKKLAKLPKMKSTELPTYRPSADPREFQLEREGTGWRLSGESLERAAAMTYWEYDQSVRRFQRILERLGVTELLKEQGVKEGDSVFIGEHELEWQE